MTPVRLDDFSPQTTHSVRRVAAFLHCAQATVKRHIETGLIAASPRSDGARGYLIPAEEVLRVRAAFERMPKREGRDGKSYTAHGPYSLTTNPESDA